jgi:hypothetical protein
MRAEYDFDYSKTERGKYFKRLLREGSNVVVLDRDVAKAFPDSAAVQGAALGDEKPQAPPSETLARAFPFTRVGSPGKRRGHEHQSILVRCGRGDGAYAIRLPNKQD